MESFYRSLLTPRLKVFGYHLKPFSVYHLAILKALNSPFVIVDQDIRPAEVIIFLKVCSIQFPEQPDLVNLSFLDRWKTYFITFNKKAFIEIVKGCSWYIKEHQYYPEYMSSDSGFNLRDLNAPPDCSMITNLIKNGIPHEEALNLPISYANWLIASFAELDGDKRTFFDPLEKKSFEDEVLTPDKEVEIARKALPPQKFKKWLKARNENSIHS